MKKTFLLPLFAVLFLSACGGGGGSSGSPGSPSAPDLMSAPASEAMTNFYTQPQSVTLHTTDSGGNNYAIGLELVPGQGTTTFNGMTASYAKAATTLSENGTVVATSTTFYYFHANPFELFGSVASNGTLYQVYGTPEMVPGTVSVGQSGTIGSSTYFHDSTEAVQDAQSVDTFTAQANSPDTLLFCDNQQISNVTAQGTADGLGNGTESDCYAIDANGNAKLVRATIAVSGGQVTFR